MKERDIQRNRKRASNLFVAREPPKVPGQETQSPEHANGDRNR